MTQKVFELTFNISRVHSSWLPFNLYLWWWFGWIVWIDGLLLLLLLVTFLSGILAHLLPEWNEWMDSLLLEMKCWMRRRPDRDHRKLFKTAVKSIVVLAGGEVFCILHDFSTVTVTPTINTTYICLLHVLNAPGWSYSSHVVRGGSKVVTRRFHRSCQKCRWQDLKI